MQRRYDLDWLRVLAFALLIFYHAGMMYVPWHWHITSNYQSEALELAMRLVNPWRLPLLFFISGCALFFARERYAKCRLLRLRSERLLVPLVFGILVIVPPQLFFEMRQGGEVTGSYWDFWWAYLQPNHPLFNEHRTPLFGQMTWNHLWFIPYLWCYSVMLLGLNNWLRPLFKLINSLRLRWILLAPALLFAAYGFWLRPHYPSSHALLDDWYNHSVYFTVFVLGYGFASCDQLWQKIRNQHWPLLGLAMVCYGVLMWEHSLPEDTGLGEAIEYWGDILFDGLYYLNLWCWILALCALAMRFLNRDSAALHYANGAVYPYYILHQSLTVSLGYGLVALNMNPWLEPTSIILLTFLGCALGYEIIRRVRSLRWLFGLAPLPSRDNKEPRQELSGSA